ncbi:sigma-70 family RNA polymerase sigma factor [Nocardiopsis sp. HUAS JQ3]|uniref:sigma-70 family RNA polymerase sigma factor n=1 Tax=Nocardiopsis sp. HUAS JQ3 TaxID=3061629 RepID=UPI0023A9E716|nr:sigma-70 family RNA polymerase sigma factor [Nocardiopsis sp. HUAS JQ3]WDZ92077.1 sigma-70 family RNA polymerase sigma factor [Nocardiopsis sp. HUAS JQ3]
MTRGSEPGEPSTVEALYDAFAPSLYRYAWSLLGEDTGQTAEAVHDGLVAGVVLDSRRADPADLGSWLYALVRSACQRRGLAHASPYTRLATVPAEEPVARMFSRLPASHRELVELNLRHALPTSAVARVLGLDPQICGELTRSAIRRAAENLDGRDGDHRVPDPRTSREAGASGGAGDTGGPGTAAWRAQVHDVSQALALLRPPGPPPGLREAVVRTCTDPDLAAARERIAAQMHPLTGEGYPMHRSRAAGAAEEENEAAEPGPEAPPRALPGDRLTTRDHPVRDEAVTPLAGPGSPAVPDDSGDGPDDRRTARRRWPTAAVSGLATVVLAVALWGWASAVGGPSTMIGAGPDETERGPLVPQVETDATSADTKPEAGPTPEPPTAPTEPTEPGAEAEQRQEDGGGSGHQALDPAPERTTPAPPPQEASPPSGGEGPDGAPGAPGEEESGDDDAPGGPPEEDGDDDGGGKGLLDGLLGLLFGGG